MNRRNLILSASSIALLSSIYPIYQLFNSAPVLKNNLKVRAAFIKIPQGFNRRTFYKPDYFTDKIACEYSFQTGSHKTIPIQTEGHVVETHPFEQNLSVIFSRFTGTLSVVDWNTEKEIAHFVYPNDDHVYGHGAFSDDGKILFVSSTEGYVPNKGGSIYCFEFPNLKLVEVIKMPYGPPHDIISLGKDKFLFGTDGADNKGAYTIFDAVNKKFEYFPIIGKQSKDDKVLVHMKQIGRKVVANYQVKTLSEGDILRQGGLVAFDLDNQKTETLLPLGSFNVGSEMLSLDYDPVSGYIWYTVPGENRIIVWDIKTKSLVKMIPTPSLVSSVSFLPEIEAVLVGLDRQFLIYDSKLLSRIEKLESKLSFQKIARMGLYHTHTRIV